MKAFSAVLISLLALSDAFATSPKELCQIQKTLQAQVASDQSVKSVRVEVVLEYTVRLSMGQPSVTYRFDLTPTASQKNPAVLILEKNINFSAGSSLYVQNLSLVRTRYLATGVDGSETLVSEEVENPLVYVEGQTRPVGPVVCYQWAS